MGRYALAGWIAGTVFGFGVGLLAAGIEHPYVALTAVLCGGIVYPLTIRTALQSEKGDA